jgi:hypothetical protein
VFVTDVIELMKGTWLNVSIVQIFLHVRIYLTLISLMLRFKYNNDVFICLQGSGNIVRDV